MRASAAGGAEVVVVGGGPAGATAALTLAGLGVDVLVLDRHRFPRDKPCGGGIRFAFLRRFPAIAERLRERVALHEIRRVRMESPSGASVVADGETPLYLTMRRTEFDAALLDLARARGARVIEGARVDDVETSRAEAIVRCHDGREFAARIVVGADGVNSVVARAVGLAAGAADDRLAIDTMEETPLGELATTDPEEMFVAYGYRGWQGYGYVFPKRDCVDAGVGFLVSFFKARLRGAPAEHHRRFLEDAAGKGIVRGGSRPENVKAYRLPLGGPLPRACRGRVVVCGDAGGFVNAYTGEGIYYAMVTGEHAGVAAGRALATGADTTAALAGYEARWRAEIGHELADSVRIQRRLFADPRLVDRVIRAAGADPRLCRLLARIALGETDIRRHRLELAWRFLLAALRRRTRLLAPARAR